MPQENEPTPISGVVDQRFQRVRDAFADGFVCNRDVGAALSVVVDGRMVVDIWGGYRDRKRTQLWQADTLCCMFSISKAMAAVCVLQAVAEGLVDLDRSVQTYWPEFGQAAKGNVSVRQLMSHQAGLVGFHEVVPKDLYYRWDDTVALLAAEPTWWEPGTRHGYHARTFGFLLGELLSRVSAKRIAAWFSERIATLLELDFAIGLPASLLGRCAEMIPARVRPGESRDLSPAALEMMRDMSDRTTITGAAFQNPSFPPGYMNSDAFRRAEIPAVNGHGTARSVARTFARLPALVPGTLLAEATTTQSMGSDLVLKSFTRFGLGFMLHHERAPIGIAPGTFGHAGAGGSMAFYDPHANVGFCFAMNQLQEGVVTGGTSAMLTARAVYDCLSSSG